MGSCSQGRTLRLHAPGGGAAVKGCWILDRGKPDLGRSQGSRHGSKTLIFVAVVYVRTTKRSKRPELKKPTQAGIKNMRPINTNTSRRDLVCSPWLPGATPELSFETLQAPSGESISRFFPSLAN